MSAAPEEFIRVWFRCCRDWLGVSPIHARPGKCGLCGAKPEVLRIAEPSDYGPVEPEDLDERIPCPECDGIGIVGTSQEDNGDCPACGGTGW